MRTSLYVLLVFFFGCASQPKDIATISVSPILYQKYTCDQIISEADRVSRNAQRLYASLKETADTDAMQMTVGLLLLWPTLFFLEGSDGAEAIEYARIKGESEALEKAAIAKNCQMDVFPKVDVAKEFEKAEKAESMGLWEDEEY